MKTWELRWKEGRIGFHLPNVNPYLRSYSEKFLDKSPRNIFVPLCGKTLDMIWFAKRIKRVVGIELVSHAIEEFYKENNLSYSIFVSGKLKLFKNNSIDIFHGDFFKLTKEETGLFQAIYDRASLVALGPRERQKYVEHLMPFLASHGNLLLITLEYNQNQMNGPPFSVPKKEIDTLFGRYGKLELLEARDILDERLRNKGLEKITEHVHLLVKN